MYAINFMQIFKFKKGFFNGYFFHAKHVQEIFDSTDNYKSAFIVFKKIKIRK